MFKVVRKVFVRFDLLIFQVFFLACHALPAWADPFAVAEAKTKELAESLANYAGALALAVITFAGIALMFGKLSKEWGFKIIGGAFIVGSASQVASWIMAR